MFSLARRDEGTERRDCGHRNSSYESDLPEKDSILRNRVIEEIISSERTYVNFLRALSENFELPLRLNHMVPSDVHNAIFRNLQAILRLNEELYDHLSRMELGEAFLDMAPFLKLYSHYARHHFQAVNVLQEWLVKSSEFNEFVAAQEKKPEIGLKLNALLIMPVQRIPRYEMLLRELLRLTPPNNFPEEFNSLSRGLDAVVDVARHINEHVRLAENTQHMRDIEARFALGVVPRVIAPGRKFIKEGVLKKISRRDGSACDRVFFLFSDILMYAKSAMGSAATSPENDSLVNAACKLKCCAILPLHHCRIERIFGLTQDADALMFKISCKRSTLILFMPERDIGEAWINALESAIRKVQNDRLTLRKESSAKEPMGASEFNKVDALKRKIDEKASSCADDCAEGCYAPKLPKNETPSKTAVTKTNKTESSAKRFRCVIL